MKRITIYIILGLTLLWPVNSFAIAGGHEPEPNVSIVEGTVTKVSSLPIAEANPYPDCYFTALLEIHQIVSGRSVPQKVILVLPGFFSRKYAAEAGLKVGDKITAKLMPFSLMPANVKETQQADEIEDSDLEIFFADNVSAIKDFKAVKKPVPFLVEENSLRPEKRLFSIVPEDKAARQEQIQKDLREVKAALSRHGGDWDKWYSSLKPFRDNYNVTYSAKASKWIDDSFFSAGYLDNSNIYSPDFVKSVVALKNYLAARNVDLILVRVPNKGEVDYDLFTPVPDDHVSNPYLLKMYKELLEADVEIVTNIIPKAKEKRLKFPLMYWYQDFEQNHPAEGMAWVIAEELSDRLKRYSRIRSLPKKKYSIGSASTAEDWIGFKWPTGNPKFSSDDYVGFSTVIDDNGHPVTINRGLDSPVLVLGSSFITAPSIAKGASIPSYIAYLTGVVPDMLQRRDGDFMMPRLIAQEGEDSLRNRVVCVFPFVPWVAHKALAQLPAFDTEKSAKALVASYSGPDLETVLHPDAGKIDPGFMFSKDGALHLQPHNSKSNSSVTFQLKLPESVRKYSHFVVSLDLSSKDFTGIKVAYGKQVDTIKRSGQATEERFGFTATPEGTLTFDIVADRYKKVPVEIKGVRLYGVEKPLYYKVGE